MYPPMELDGGTTYYLKPMNCPFHTLIFKSNQRSYRDLPVRYFEFGSVFATRSPASCTASLACGA